MTDAYTIATWSESPFTSYDRRGQTIEHRVRLILYERDMLDVVHEARGEDDTGVPADWTEIRVWEARQGRVTSHQRRDVMRRR